MRSLLSIIALLILGGSSQAAEYSVRFSAAENFLPSMKTIAIVDPDSRKSAAEISKYNETTKLPSEGPYDIWWYPKTGLGVRVVSGLKLKNGEVTEIKLDKYLGVINLRGENEPRAALVTIAPRDDPGPGEKGHIAIQTAKEYRVDMVAPEGFYSLWITPANGGRPRKINDRLKVQAGKSVQLD